MAATYTSYGEVLAVPFFIRKVKYMTLEPGVTITHSHGGPSGVEPFMVLHQVVQRPNDRSVVSFAWDESANSTTNDTIAIQFDCDPGGDLTGAEVEVYIIFIDAASGGIS